MNKKVRIFIGSSTESLTVAKAIKANFENDDNIEVRIWNEEMFNPGQYTLDELIRFTKSFDFGIFVWANDDKVEIETRNILQTQPRDNVIFEAGMFYSALGKDRVFLFAPKENNPKIPSDLFGLHPIRYNTPTDDNYASELSTGVNRVRRVVGKLGHLRSDQMDKVTRGSIKLIQDIDYCEYSKMPTLNKCKVKNSNDSNLRYLFLNVIDCRDARQKIKKYFQEKNIIESICGLYDIYGRLDILVKYRSPESLSDDINSLLGDSHLLTNEEEGKEIKINIEQFNWLDENNESYNVLTNKEEYIESTWHSCFLRVFVHNNDSYSKAGNKYKYFLASLKDKIQSKKYDNLKQIVRNVCIQDDGESIIFDLLFSCRNFPLLHQLTGCIEDVIADMKLRTDKHTHIVYYHEEYQP